MPTWCPPYTRHGHEPSAHDTFIPHTPAGDGCRAWITAAETRKPRVREVKCPLRTGMALKGQNTGLEPCFQFLEPEFLASKLEGYRRVRDGIQRHASQILEEVFVQKTGTTFWHSLQPKHDESFCLQPKVRFPEKETNTQQGPRDRHWLGFHLSQG